MSVKSPLGLSGDEGTRTPDLLRAREALFQLSHIPMLQKVPVRPREVGLSGLEPETFPLSEECSSRLS